MEKIILLKSRCVSLIILSCIIFSGCDIKEENANTQSSYIVEESSVVSSGSASNGDASEYLSSSLSSKEDILPKKNISSEETQQEHENTYSDFFVPKLEYKAFDIDGDFLEILKSADISYKIIDNFFAIDDYILFYTYDSDWEGKSCVYVQLPDNSIELILSATQTIKRMYIVNNETIGIDFVYAVYGYGELLASDSYQFDLTSGKLAKVENFVEERAYEVNGIDGEWYLITNTNIAPVTFNIYIKTDGEKVLKAEQVSNFAISDDIIYYTVLEYDEDYDVVPKLEHQIYSLNKKGMISETYSIAGDDPRFNVYRNKIIYSNDIGVFVYDMKNKTEIRIEGLDGLMWSNIYFKDGFYSNISNKLCFVTYNGVINTILNDFSPNEYWIIDNWLYYCRDEEDDRDYRYYKYYRVNLKDQSILSLTSDNTWVRTQ